MPEASYLGVPIYRDMDSYRCIAAEAKQGVSAHSASQGSWSFADAKANASPSLKVKQDAYRIVTIKQRYPSCHSLDVSRTVNCPRRLYKAAPEFQRWAATVTLPLGSILTTQRLYCLDDRSRLSLAYSYRCTADFNDENDIQYNLQKITSIQSDVFHRSKNCSDRLSIPTTVATLRCMLIMLTAPRLRTGPVIAFLEDTCRASSYRAPFGPNLVISAYNQVMSVSLRLPTEFS
nr:hypothetical protein CFP56_39030 [Quercus suber]